MPDTAPERTQTCPTCGCRVRVVGGDEGTHHYEPAQPRVELAQQLETLRREQLDGNNNFPSSYEEGRHDAYRDAADRLARAFHPASTTGEARVEELRAAYEAGFEESSEGYNGEYVGRKHRGNWPHFLDDGFKEFLSTRAIPASTPEPEEN